MANNSYQNSWFVNVGVCETNTTEIQAEQNFESRWINRCMNSNLVLLTAFVKALLAHCAMDKMRLIRALKLMFRQAVFISFQATKQDVQRPLNILPQFFRHQLFVSCVIRPATLDCSREKCWNVSPHYIRLTHSFPIVDPVTSVLYSSQHVQLLKILSIHGLFLWTQPSVGNLYGIVSLSHYSPKCCVA